MAESSTMITLPQMCDLALNTPEVGIVNFTVLHSLLQVIINQLGLVDTCVEFRGTDSERIQNFISSSKPGTALTLTQYTVEESTAGGKTPKDKRKVSIEEKGSKDENQKEKKGRGSKDIGSDKDSNRSTIVLVQSSKGQLPGAHFTVTLTKESFDKITDNVETLENRIRELEELPTNSKLIEALTSDTGEKTPLLDMFQILTLQKKMDAAEMGIERLASMIEKLARGTTVEISDINIPKTSRGQSQDSATSVAKLEDRVKKLEKAIKQGAAHVSGLGNAPGPGIAPGPVNVPGPINVPGPGNAPEPGQASVASVPKMATESQSIFAGGTPKPNVVAAVKDSVVDVPDLEVTDISQIPVNQALEILKEEVLSIRNLVSVFPQIMKQIEEFEKILSSGGSEDQPVEVRVRLLEGKFEEILEQIDSLDNGFSRQVTSLQNRLGGLDKNMGEILEKVHLLPEEGKGDNNITVDLHNQLSTLTDDFVTVSETVQRLSEERDSRQHAIEVMGEQIELLKTVKADREDLEDALADKADACQINRKVSFEQFDQACGDMSKTLEEALAKLTQQESLWNQALENIQGEIGGKLDKNELNPLRDFINGKLKSLQEKFKTLNALKKENEAAGTKSKYLRNVNCISCDKDVVMRKEMDPSLFPPPNAVPPTRSMGPYLAYELDQLRKQQKCLPSSKNMNAFENALQASRAAKSSEHTCNRYCGGSHTVTTPTQRVTRLGHFLEQWGPEISPINDTHVRGTDGRMYKSRDDDGLKQLASEKPPTPHNDSKPPVFITPRKKTATSETERGISVMTEQNLKESVDRLTKPT